MAYNYLTLTNRVLKAFNEVPLTSSDFDDAEGFHADVKDCINDAIYDIYMEEDNEWPFAWAENTENTVLGTQEYTKETTETTIDWDSFRINRPKTTISSLTQSAGTATATVASTQYFETGDVIPIYGATQTAYNGESVTITVVNSTTFTYSVDSATTTPATGTIYCYPAFSVRKLPVLPYDDYRKRYLEIDKNTTDPDSFGVPEFVVRLPDNNFMVSPKPDRVYPITYEAFSIATPLVAYNDAPEIPEAFQSVIKNRALYYAYMFRDNIEEASKADDEYIKTIRNMRRLLIPMDGYMRFE